MSNTRKPFANVFANLHLDEVKTLVDLGATSANFALQCHKRFDCDVVVIPVNGEGKFDDDSAKRAENYLERLTERGFPTDKMRVLHDGEQIPPADLLASLNYFGSEFKIEQARDWLNSILQTNSRFVFDIRQGSGAYKFIKQYGNTQTVAKFDDKDKKRIHRVVLSVEPNEILEPDERDSFENWRDEARELVGKEGFYTEKGKHSFTFIPRNDTLIVSFDNLDIAMKNRADKKPWGFSFIEKRGWSMLGVMAGGWTWYRDPWVSEEFIRLRDEGFFEQFSRVVFYGASMGGYAALAFSAAAPQADVLAFSPQTILDKSIVPWETRYKVAWNYDYSGQFGDGALASQKAQKVYVFYDPYAPLDNAHVKRLTGDNVERYRAPLMGHKVGTNFERMGILSNIVTSALKGELNRDQYRDLLAKRKSMRRYMKELVVKLRDSNHDCMAWVVCDYYNKNVSSNDGFFISQKSEIEKTSASKLPKTSTNG